MEDFVLDLDLARKLAEELASEEYGSYESIEKDLCIEGTLFYAIRIERDGLEECQEVTSTHADQWANEIQLNALVVYAAYDHFFADLDWALDHFHERTGQPNVNGAKAFAEKHLAKS